MKEQLEIKYGELMQLEETCGEYYLKRQYKEKMDAIMILLKPMYYYAPNPITEE